MREAKGQEANSEIRVDTVTRFLYVHSGKYTFQKRFQETIQTIGPLASENKFVTCMSAANLRCISRWELRTELSSLLVTFYNVHVE